MYHSNYKGKAMNDFQRSWASYDAILRGSPWQENMTRFLMRYEAAGIERAHMSQAFKKGIYISGKI